MRVPLEIVASGRLVVAAEAQKMECTLVHEYFEHRRTPPAARAVEL